MFNKGLEDPDRSLTWLTDLRQRVLTVATLNSLKAKYQYCLRHTVTVCSRQVTEERGEECEASQISQRANVLSVEAVTGWR